MLICLPPSEGKTAPQSGPSLDLDGLSVPAFTEIRSSLIDQLEQTSKKEDALALLGAPKGAAGQVAAQRDIASLPCAPAWQIYTGVLFQGADFGSLSEEEMSRASDSVLIFSGLFGATSPTDLICDHRLPMGAKLPGGTPKAQWRSHWHHLDARGEEQLVIDGRSGDYAGWKPPASADHVTITACRVQGDKRKVITHHAKHYRGLVTHLALRADTAPATGEDVADLAASLIGPEVSDIEFDEKTRVLTLLVP